MTTAGEVGGCPTLSFWNLVKRDTVSFSIFSKGFLVSKYSFGEERDMNTLFGGTLWARLDSSLQ